MIINRNPIVGELITPMDKYMPFWDDKKCKTGFVTGQVIFEPGDVALAISEYNMMICILLRNGQVVWARKGHLGVIE